MIEVHLCCEQKKAMLLFLNLICNLKTDEELQDILQRDCSPNSRRRFGNTSGLFQE